MANVVDLVVAKIRELRAANNWSQEELAEAAGLSRDAVSRIERGDRDPRFATLAALAEALGVPLSEIMVGGGPLDPARRDAARLRKIERCLALVDEGLADRIVDAVGVLCADREKRSDPRVKGTPRRPAGRRPSRRPASQ